MELKMEKEEYYVVDYAELNRFVNEYYSFEDELRYDFADDQEAHNDSTHTFYITGKIDDYEEEDLKEVLEDELPCHFIGFMTDTFLNDLARKDVIPKGNYLINVCW